MQLRVIVHTIAGLLLIIGLTMLIPFGVALGYGEGDAESLLLAALVVSLSSGVLFRLTRHRPARGPAPVIGHREGLVIVALTWLAVGLVGGIPFYFFAHRPVVFIPERAAIPAYAPPEMGRALHGSCSGPGSGGPGSEFCSFVNCAFEATSGFTTTGASIIADSLWQAPRRTRPSELPHGIMFWRFLTHFLGGMGIIVLSIAILPMLGVGGMQLYDAEIPGPTADRLLPRLAATARALWLLYLGLVIVQMLVLLLVGLDLFNAICLAFATIATGGFATIATSVAGFSNTRAEVVITIFMLLAGMNFALHFLLLRGQWRKLLGDIELRFYLGIAAVTTMLCAAPLLLASYQDWGVGKTLNKAAFQVVSILTTTGFASDDYERWELVHPLPMILLLALMVVGGCAGSTAGGPKVIRLWVSLAHGLREIYRLVHPRAVAIIRIGSRAVSQEVIDGIHGFWMLYLLAFVVVTIFVAAHGIDLVTAASGTLATLGNIGPGFGKLGPMASYNFLPASVKAAYVLCMTMGRLKVYTLVVLFSSHLWRR